MTLDSFLWYNLYSVGREFFQEENTRSIKMYSALVLTVFDIQHYLN